MPTPANRKSSTAQYVTLALYMVVSMTYLGANISGFLDNYFDLHHRPDTPFHFDADSHKVISVAPEWKHAGIGPGDTLLSVQGETYTGRARFLTILRDELHPGDTLHLTVRKPDGRKQNAAIVLTGRKPGDHAKITEYSRLLLLFGLSPLVCLLIGYWVVIARPRDPNAWLVLFILTFPETLLSIAAGWWPGGWDVFQNTWMQLQQGLSPLALLLFGIYFPERWRFDRKAPWLKWLIGAGVVAALLSLPWIIAGEEFASVPGPLLERLNFWGTKFTDWVAFGCIALYWIAIFDKARSASTADARRRLQVLGAGSLIGIGALVLFVLASGFGINTQQPWVSITASTLFLVFPLTLAYVVVVQRAMDVRILLRMGTKYALARATLAIVRGGLAAALVFALVYALRAPAITPGAITALVVLGALFLLLRSRWTRDLSSWLDRKFFREAYNAEQLLTELSQRVRKFNDSGPMLEMVAQQLQRTLHIDKIAVLLRGQDGFGLQQASGLEFAGAPGNAAVRLPFNSTTIRNLTRINSPVKLYRENPDGWLLLASQSERSLLDWMSAELLLPLPGREQLMGLMTLGPKRSEEPYTPSDLRLLESVATQTGLALEIGELARSLASAAAQRERINREIEVAREVQERLFPQELPVLDGVTLAGHCRPAQGVGGDYYDLFPLEDGRIGIAIGDVSGKGISAALLMASLRASLRGMTLDAPRDLALTIEKVNRLVYEASASNRYATFFFATYDPADHNLAYVNAGHNAPFIVRRIGDAFEVKRLEAGGPVVGLLPVVAYEEQHLTLLPGDLLLTYTDGISEAMTIEDEEWGEERMREASEAAHGMTASQIVEHLLAEADRFTGNAPQHDDMTLLILKLDARPAAALPNEGA